MPFINSFSINTDKQNPFPFNIPAVRFARQVKLDARVTIFVGDNGTGKSTLLESIAFYLKLPLIGGHISSSASFEAARSIKPYLELEWKRETNKGFFFRAEDFSDFINGVEKEKNKIAGELSELKGKVKDSIIEELSMSETMNYTLREMRRNMVKICRPIPMGRPSMQQVNYKETDHYRITKTFLDNPEHYLRHM